MPGGRPVELAGGVAPPASPAWPPKWGESHTHSWGLPTVSWPPTADQLDYTQKAITVALLLLALPALLALLIHRPSRLVTGLARKHVA